MKKCTTNQLASTRLALHLFDILRGCGGLLALSTSRIRTVLYQRHKPLDVVRLDRRAARGDKLRLKSGALWSCEPCDTAGGAARRARGAPTRSFAALRIRGSKSRSWWWLGGGARGKAGSRAQSRSRVRLRPGVLASGAAFWIMLLTRRSASSSCSWLRARLLCSPISCPLSACSCLYASLMRRTHAPPSCNLILRLPHVTHSSDRRRLPASRREASVRPPVRARASASSTGWKELERRRA